MERWLRVGQEVLADGDEVFVILSKPLVSFEEDEDGMNRGVGLEEKGEGEGVEGVGGFEMEMESPRWVLALRIKERIIDSGPKAKRIISFSPWS